MAKRKIPVSNNQANETKLINSLNSNLLKKEDKNANSIKESLPDKEEAIDSFINSCEESLAETEVKPATNNPQDALDELNT